MSNPTRRTVDPANIVCGSLFIALGLFFGIQSLNLEIGTALRMGPGYFPLVLAGLLVVLGIVVLVQGFRAGGEPMGAVAWRGLFFILAAPIFFGITIRGLGFVPTVFFTAIIAAFASRRMRLPVALLIAAVITVFTTLVFSYALGLPFARFGSWLPFAPPF